ncbi:DNA methyltransferase [Listeria monocytogenes]|nr:DNA methyltransferase [Listeria monocytogenes]GAM95825.1 DNA methyltransferase [Listeria monocytogenes]
MIFSNLPIVSGMIASLSCSQIILPFSLTNSNFSKVTSNFSNCCFLYGGSKKTRSNFHSFLWSNLSARSASFRYTSARSVKWHPSKFWRIVLIASAAWSIKTARSAPLLNASIPSPPLPANKSSTISPSKKGPIIENKDSFTLSVVGLVLFPGTAFRACPFRSPAMTLMFLHNLYFNVFFTLSQIEAKKQQD